MRKREELTDPNSCLNRAKDDEMLFVLLGRDFASTATVRFWIEERIRLGKNRPEDEQIVEAEQWINTVTAEQAELLCKKRLETLAELTAQAQELDMGY